MFSIRRLHARRRTRGQSLVEFALVAPVLLLIVLLGIDAGRLFFGWVNLQNTARIGANFAGIHPTAWNVPGSAPDRARYQAQIQNDATVINCTLPNPLPTPEFPDGQELGDLAVLGLDCEFDVLTPVVSAIIGESVTLSASAEFPIRTGIIAGGITVPPPGPIPTPTPTPTPTPCAPPVAEFSAAPLAGNDSVVVNITDLSTTSAACPILSWSWAFEGASPASATGPGPHTVTFTRPPVQHDVSLTVTNAGGSDTETKNNYVRTNS
jgi:hypothetical protein